MYHLFFNILGAKFQKSEKQIGVEALQGFFFLI
jgi:hypothetical protein